jgi:glycosyltransferase involved in cell wall biosynthesis
MIQLKLFVCLPILNESENIPRLIDALKKQSYQNFELVACVNQPEDWWSLEDKVEQCIDNQKSIEILEKENQFLITIIDKSSKGSAWQGKQKGVGWARKLAMDKAATLGSDFDLIVSIDADTDYPEDYLLSVADIFKKKPKIVGLSNPYYHRLSNNKEANLAILRYEIYMRNYAINMILIDNPYQFTALGSAMATTVKVYNKMGGISPKASGEDFYFLQKLSKFGLLENWNKTKVFPASRFSDRVNFGTGPAMIKGNTGDWSSYPIYHFTLFEKVKSTYSTFQNLFEKDLETAMTAFLKYQLKKENIWASLRKNYKTKEQFVKACTVLVDGLRILQFLKQESKNEEDSQSDNLKDNLLYFSTIDNKYSSKLAGLAQSFDLNTLSSLENLRDTLTNFEYSLRKLKSKY